MIQVDPEKRPTALEVNCLVFLSISLLVSCFSMDSIEIVCALIK